MRRSTLVSVALLGLTVAAAFAMRGPGSADHRRRRALPATVDILLVSGLHPNEACAPLTAREVLQKLGDLGKKAALFEIPHPYTLLALIDDPAHAVTAYSMPAGDHRLDVDLDGLDRELGRLYPGALTFEFHNSEDTQPMLGIEPGKPVEEYEVGSIGPGSERPFEIGTWRDVDPQGRPGKFVIELPACYTLEGPSVRDRRRRRLMELREAGCEFDPRWRHYLERKTDVDASRHKGYLKDCLAEKVADWIRSRWNEGS